MDLAHTHARALLLNKLINAPVVYKLDFSRFFLSLNFYDSVHSNVHTARRVSPPYIAPVCPPAKSANLDTLGETEKKKYNVSPRKQCRECVIDLVRDDPSRKEKW